MTLGTTVALRAHTWSDQRHFPIIPVLIFLIAASFCIVNLICLLKDQKGGYSTARLSLATILWGLACFPVGVLCVGVVREIVRTH